MSITDELREWGRATLMPSLLIKMETIADRIDAEHQKAEDEWRAKNGDMWLKGYAACHEELMEGHPVIAADLEKAGWVKLPKDADGVPIRFGDKVTVPWNENVYEVSGFSYTQQLAGGKRTIWVDVYSREKMGNVPLCGSSSCRHYHAPTVEDVLEELLREYDRDDSELTNGEIVEMFAKRLQLREDA